MTDVLKQLFSTNANKKPGAASNTTVYTVPASTTAMLTRIVITNQSSVPTSFRIAIVPSGGTVGNNYDWVAYDVPIGGNETINFALGCGMATGDFIVIYNTLATCSFCPFGIEIT